MPKFGQLLDGKYRLEGLLAEGGMGAVWTAKHEVLGRTYAVKFLKQGQDGGGAIQAERFLREARMAASVQHRFVISLFDFGATPQGELYMVMELLEGQTLATRLAQPPPLALREVGRLVGHVLSGLAAVHDQGIVHRDLKPENIFLVSDADGVFPKLLDFGISRPDAEVRLEGQLRSLTGAGLAMGTPFYMSPEQVRGRRDLDERADLYAVGVLLYRASTGQFPIEAETVPDLLVKVLVDTPATASALRPELPAAWSDVIMRALAREPDQRFASATEMRLALEAACEELRFDAACRWPLERAAALSPEELFGSPASASAPSPAASPRSTPPHAPGGTGAGRWRRLVPAGLAAGALGLGLAILVDGNTREGGARRSGRGLPPPVAIATSGIAVEPIQTPEPPPEEARAASPPPANSEPRKQPSVKLRSRRARSGTTRTTAR